MQISSKRRRHSKVDGCRRRALRAARAYIVHPSCRFLSRWVQRYWFQGTGRQGRAPINFEKWGGECQYRIIGIIPSGNLTSIISRHLNLHQSRSGEYHSLYGIPSIPYNHPTGDVAYTLEELLTQIVKSIKLTSV